MNCRNAERIKQCAGQSLRKHLWFEKVTYCFNPLVWPVCWRVKQFARGGSEVTYGAWMSMFSAIQDMFPVCYTLAHPLGRQNAGGYQNCSTFARRDSCGSRPPPGSAFQ